MYLEQSGVVHLCIKVGTGNNYDQNSEIFAEAMGREFLGPDVYPLAPIEWCIKAERLEGDILCITEAVCFERDENHRVTENVGMVLPDESRETLNRRLQDIPRSVRKLMFFAHPHYPWELAIRLWPSEHEGAGVENWTYLVNLADRIPN